MLRRFQGCMVIHLDERNVMRTLTAYIEFDPETNLYVGFVPGVAGAHSQGATLDELHENLKEVLELCREEDKAA